MKDKGGDTPERQPAESGKAAGTPGGDGTVADKARHRVAREITPEAQGLIDLITLNPVALEEVNKDIKKSSVPKDIAELADAAILSPEAFKEQSEAIKGYRLDPGTEQGLDVLNPAAYLEEAGGGGSKDRSAS